MSGTWSFLMGRLQEGSVMTNRGNKNSAYTPGFNQCLVYTTKINIVQWAKIFAYQLEEIEISKFSLLQNKSFTEEFLSMSCQHFLLNNPERGKWADAFLSNNSAISKMYWHESNWKHWLSVIFPRWYHKSWKLKHGDKSALFKIEQLKPKVEKINAYKILKYTECVH